MSRNQSGCAVGVLFAALFAVQTGIVLADTITIDVSTDVWIRQSNPGTTYENDNILIANSPGKDNGQERRGAIEFDLSGVTEQIAGAYLNLYNYYWSDNTGAISQVGASMNSHGIGSLTWNTMGSYTDFETLGAYNLADNHEANRYYSSSASAADVAVLEGLRTSSDKKLTMLLRANSGFLNWGDAYNGNPVAQIVVTTVPEPSAIALLVAGLLSLLAYAWRKRRQLMIWDF
jgi:hypothetical protein